jgi:hypothetical protein
LFAKYGVLENPFPAAGQPFGHPHLETTVDLKIVDCIQEFEDDHKTQVLVIEGTQGVGKTNLLNYYQNELEDLYQADETFYIIRYYPDPEPSFDAILRKIFQELGGDHLEIVAQKLSELNSRDGSNIIDTAKSHEIRMVLHSLRRSVRDGDDKVKEVSEAAMEWLLGVRLLKKHKQALGVNFRLDTIESKTQALRDLVLVSIKLETIQGIFLLLDELEKQDYSLSKTPIIRYLSAIRALIDALPSHLFMMMALTPEARRRYFTMLPAIAGRLQNVYTLSPLRSFKEAVSLYNLYLKEARWKAELNKDFKNITQAFEDIFLTEEIKRIFSEQFRKSAERGIQGVTHRDFLNELHGSTQTLFKELLSS